VLGFRNELRTSEVRIFRPKSCSTYQLRFSDDEDDSGGGAVWLRVLFVGCYQQLFGISNKLSKGGEPQNKRGEGGRQEIALLKVSLTIQPSCRNWVPCFICSVGGSNGSSKAERRISDEWLPLLNLTFHLRGAVLNRPSPPDQRASNSSPTLRV